MPSASRRRFRSISSSAAMTDLGILFYTPCIGQDPPKIQCTEHIDLEAISIIIRTFTYDRDAHIVSGRKGMITIENLSPVLSDEERVEQRRCIEEGLFEVFIKYANQKESDRYFGAAAV